MIEKMNHSDLEKRLRKFALDVLRFTMKLPKTEGNSVYTKQVIRSSSSVGANYSEAVYAHTKADFLHDLNKSRKEASESVYWLKLLLETYKIHFKEAEILIDEGDQLLRILISSIKTTKDNMTTKSSIINNKS